MIASPEEILENQEFPVKNATWAYVVKTEYEDEASNKNLFAQLVDAEIGKNILY